MMLVTDNRLLHQCNM